MPEDEVPAALFSSGRLSATENGLEKVVGGWEPLNDEYALG